MFLLLPEVVYFLKNSPNVTTVSSKIIMKYRIINNGSAFFWNIPIIFMYTRHIPPHNIMEQIPKTIIPIVFLKTLLSTVPSFFNNHPLSFYFISPHIINYISQEFSTMIQYFSSIFFHFFNFFTFSIIFCFNDKTFTESSSYFLSIIFNKKTCNYPFFALDSYFPSFYNFPIPKININVKLS